MIDMPYNTNTVWQYPQHLDSFLQHFPSNPDSNILYLKNRIKRWQVMTPTLQSPIGAPLCNTFSISSPFIVSNSDKHKTFF